MSWLTLDEAIADDHKAGTLYVDGQNQLFMLLLAPDGYHLLRLNISAIVPDKITLADEAKIEWPLRLYKGRVCIQN